MMEQPSLFSDNLGGIELVLACPARATDPGTAHEAATANPDIRGQQRIAVLGHFQVRGGYGSTDYETGCTLGILRTSAGKRRKELCEMGLVVDSEMRRKTNTGSTAIVWRLVQWEHWRAK
jgi:hypothetical protein